MAKRRKEMARKKRARARMAKITKIAVGITILGAFANGIYEGYKWNVSHPKSSQYIHENKIDLVTKKERLEIQERFGELD